MFDLLVTGNDPNVYFIRSLKLDQGRFYTGEEQLQHARVAVLGSEAKEKLFSGRNALGEHIRIEGLSFEVVGVLSANAGRELRMTAFSTFRLPPSAI